MNLPQKQQLQKIYGESVHSMERFKTLADRFRQIYHRDPAEFFTSPGRTEIIGNHTDHNGGKVLAASISMDTIGAARPNGTDLVRITSQGYRNEIVIPLTKLRSFYDHAGTEGLVAGMLEGVCHFGFQISGFDACVSTSVIPAAGVSSSASFEMLICTMVNCFFNDGKMTCTDYAKIGKYAENTYWKKASGMMDQMACAVGGTVLFDFSDSEMPACEKMDFSFQDLGYQLVIVNTGKGHGDLSREYSEIPEEMGQAAGLLGVKLLHETTLEDLLLHCGGIENDRAVLRAIHFFEENARVEQAAACIRQRDYEGFLRLIAHSGVSSWKYLQNCYSIRNCHEQKVSLTLALTELFLKGVADAGESACVSREGDCQTDWGTLHGKYPDTRQSTYSPYRDACSAYHSACQGVCRIHGGGFAGVIMCVLPQTQTAHYVQFISRYVGEENVYPMNIRNVGAVRIGEV